MALQIIIQFNFIDVCDNEKLRLNNTWNVKISPLVVRYWY